ncbi:hypothetical protein VCHA53O466_140141 [Vibrio chagasii]|nr:hypothetical protein VCHA53O466_140141 [Vibrio chagasii]
MLTIEKLSLIASELGYSVLNEENSDTLYLNSLTKGNIELGFWVEGKQLEIRIEAKKLPVKGEYRTQITNKARIKLNPTREAEAIAKDINRRLVDSAKEYEIDYCHELAAEHEILEAHLECLKVIEGDNQLSLICNHSGERLNKNIEQDLGLYISNGSHKRTFRSVDQEALIKVEVASSDVMQSFTAWITDLTQSPKLITALMKLHSKGEISFSTDATRVGQPKMEYIIKTVSNDTDVLKTILDATK